MEGVFEFLTQEDEQLQDVLFGQHGKESLLQTSFSLIHQFWVFRDQEQLLQQHDYQFHHLILLFTPLPFRVHDCSHVIAENFYDLWRQKVYFVIVEGLENVLSCA